MKSWQILPVISAPMPFQMALDEVLFRRSESRGGLPILRFFFSSEPWTTVGYSMKSVQSGRTEKLCRRLTGGGRVEHGKDLIFSLIARKDHDDSFGSVRMSYLKIHEAIKKGYEVLNLSCEFYRCDENLPKGGDCFLYPIATDLKSRGRKVAGGAQKRSAGVLLHEESVILTEGLDPFDLMKAIRAGFEEIFQIHCADALMDPAWLEEASVLARDKYAQIMPAVDDFSGRTHWAGDHNPAKTISARQGAGCFSQQGSHERA